LTPPRGSPKGTVVAGEGKAVARGRLLSVGRAGVRRSVEAPRGKTLRVEQRLRRPELLNATLRPGVPGRRASWKVGHLEKIPVVVTA
jgi:hypothetical protein